MRQNPRPSLQSRAARRIIVSEARMAVPFVASSPDPEVPEKAQRRKFSAEDKKRILEDVDRATGHGGIGAVLRKGSIPRRYTLGGRSAMQLCTRLFLRNGVRRLGGIRWPARTKSCGARISAYRKSWRKPTSSSTFKKKWPSCWAVRFQRSPARR